MSRPERFAKPEFVPDHTLITGASGGLGQALALHYARSGTHLTLWGRNLQKLEKLAAACSAKGSTVTVHALPLTDLDAGIALFREDDTQKPVDLLILNAGVSDIRPYGALTESIESVKEAALVNYAAPVMLATAAASVMAPRRCGRIVLIGSVAAHHDLPFATAYSSSKAGLARFATSLHAAMTPHQIGVTLIEPGYIDTAMSRRLEGARPFLVPAEKAAALIAQAASSKRAVVIFPGIFAFLKLVSLLVPRAIAHRLLRLARVKQNAA